MNSQYTIAVHILTLINLSSEPISSEQIAGSVGVHPVIIRDVTGLLRRGNLVQTQRGVTGVRLVRPADQISLLDIYKVVNAPSSVLKMHQHPQPACPVGANIQVVLEEVFSQAQSALEARLASVFLTDISEGILARIA